MKSGNTVNPAARKGGFFIPAKAGFFMEVTNGRIEKSKSIAL